MSRVKRGPKARKRRKKVLKLASGFRGSRSRCFKMANEAVDKALQYAYRDRKNRKRDFRSLWIARISAMTKANGLSYSQLMKGLKKSEVMLDRKILANLAMDEPAHFSKIVALAKENL